MYSIVEPDPAAQDQIAALPAHAASYLAEVLALLEIAPWEGRPFDPDHPEGNMRVMPFGTDGWVVYLVLEPQREVYITRVQWI